MFNITNKSLSLVVPIKLSEIDIKYLQPLQSMNVRVVTDITNFKAISEHLSVKEVLVSIEKKDMNPKKSKVK